LNIQQGITKAEVGGEKTCLVLREADFGCIARMLWFGFFDVAEFERVVVMSFYIGNLRFA
jgi:hypothetical protein